MTVNSVCWFLRFIQINLHTSGSVHLFPTNNFPHKCIARKLSSYSWNPKLLRNSNPATMLAVRMSMLCTSTEYLTGQQIAMFFMDFQKENPKHEDFKVCIEQSFSPPSTPMTHEICPMLWNVSRPVWHHTRMTLAHRPLSDLISLLLT